MIKIEYVKKLPETCREAKTSAEWSEALFMVGDNLIGGIGRASLCSPREIWVELLPGFKPFSVRGLKSLVRDEVEKWGYVRGRVTLGNKRAARFAFACGFMWEEDTLSHHLFSVRA